MPRETKLKPWSWVCAFLLLTALVMRACGGRILAGPPATPTVSVPTGDAGVIGEGEDYATLVRAGSRVKRPVRRFQDDPLDHKVYLPIVLKPPRPTTYYVSKTGGNADGRSWATAWNELDQINWHAIQPGDTILLDGGITEMVYESALRIGKSGKSDAPITIRLASESGRDGKVVVFGGRSIPLPYCGQSSYAGEVGVDLESLVDFMDNSWIVLDGTKWSGITIYGGNRSGIGMNGSNNTVRNVEIYDNGKVINDGDSYTPDLPGVELRGSDVTFERVIIHDNGQDAFQSGGGLTHFTLRQSWLYNTREKPNGEIFNFCRHPDGVQIYGGGVLSGVLIEDSVIGPGFLQGLLLGEGSELNSPWAVVNDVTIRNTLFVGFESDSRMNANIHSHHTEIEPKNWTIENVTSWVPDGASTSWNIFINNGSGHVIRDSIFYGGAIYQMSPPPATSGNYQWNTTGMSVGTYADPMFVDPEGGDFALQPGSPAYGSGSSITSVAQLLSQPDPDRVLPGLSWEAEEGYIRAPFAVHDGYVSQPVETQDPALGGLATYRFAITAPGEYVVKALLDAPDSGSNSVFINIDSEPANPAMIWDVEITNGFQERTASWRGSGTPDANEFVPKVFALSSGEHKLIVRGRERNTCLDRISVEPLSH